MVSYRALLLAVVLPCVLGGESVISPEIPTEGTPYWLDCSGYGDLEYFLLHQEGDAMGVGVYTVDTMKIEVFQNATVYFESISVQHEGTHLCIRSHGSDTPASKPKAKGYSTPLRVRALPPEDLWGEVYEAKFVTGFLAALVIAALFALGCLVHKYRWVPKDQDSDPIINNAAYINPAMTKEDTESGCSTNM